jgi:hypothetical protein
MGGMELITEYGTWMVIWMYKIHSLNSSFFSIAIYSTIQSETAGRSDKVKQKEFI